MFKIHPIILTTRIVKDGEEPHYLNNCAITGGNFQSVPFNPPPVTCPVDRIRIALERLSDVIPKGIKIDLIDFNHKPYST